MEVYTQFCANLSQRSSNIISISDKSYFYVCISTEFFFDRMQVGERLTRVEIIREGVYDGYGGISGQFLNCVLTESTDSNSVYVTGQHPCAACYGLSLTEIYIILCQINGVAAQLHH